MTLDELEAAFPLGCRVVMTAFARSAITTKSAHLPGVVTGHQRCRDGSVMLKVRKKGQRTDQPYLPQFWTRPVAS